MAHKGTISEPNLSNCERSFSSDSIKLIKLIQLKFWYSSQQPEYLSVKLLNNIKISQILPSVGIAHHAVDQKVSQILGHFLSPVLFRSDELLNSLIHHVHDLRIRFDEQMEQSVDVNEESEIVLSVVDHVSRDVQHER